MTTSQTQYIVLPSTCGNSFVSELSGVLDNFFGKISGAVNSANDFTDEIRKTADVVSDIVKGMAGQITEFLNDKLIGFVQDGLAIGAEIHFDTDDEYFPAFAGYLTPSATSESGFVVTGEHSDYTLTNNTRMLRTWPSVASITWKITLYSIQQISRHTVIIKK